MAPDRPRAPPSHPKVHAPTLPTDRMARATAQSVVQAALLLSALLGFAAAIPLDNAAAYTPLGNSFQVTLTNYVRAFVYRNWVFDSSIAARCGVVGGARAD